MFELKAKLRSKETKTGEGEIPAVFYGAGTPSTPIAISLIDFKKVFRSAGESSVVSVDTGSKKFSTLIHDVQFHPVLNTPIHVDFLVVDTTHAIKTTVPLEFTGVSAAVKDFGGTLVKVMHEIEIEGMADKLPHVIEVPIEALTTLESQITVADLVLPVGIRTLEKEGDIVAAISVQKEEEETAPQNIDFSQIEVEKKGKKEEEGEEKAA